MKLLNEEYVEFDEEDESVRADQLVSHVSSLSGSTWFWSQYLLRHEAMGDDIFKFRDTCRDLFPNAERDEVEWMEFWSQIVPGEVGKSYLDGVQQSLLNGWNFLNPWAGRHQSEPEV
jgi:hypothetical protein